MFYRETFAFREFLYFITLSFLNFGVSDLKDLRISAGRMPFPNLHGDQVPREHCASDDGGLLDFEMLAAFQVGADFGISEFQFYSEELPIQMSRRCVWIDVK